MSVLSGNMTLPLIGQQLDAAICFGLRCGFSLPCGIAKSYTPVFAPGQESWYSLKRLVFDSNQIPSDDLPADPYNLRVLEVVSERVRGVFDSRYDWLSRCLTNYVVRWQEVTIDRVCAANLMGYSSYNPTSVLLDKLSTMQQAELTKRQNDFLMDAARRLILRRSFHKSSSVI